MPRQQGAVAGIKLQASASHQLESRGRQEVSVERSDLQPRESGTPPMKPHASAVQSGRPVTAVTIVLQLTFAVRSGWTLPISPIFHFRSTYSRRSSRCRAACPTLDLPPGFSARPSWSAPVAERSCSAPTATPCRPLRLSISASSQLSISRLQGHYRPADVINLLRDDTQNSRRIPGSASHAAVRSARALATSRRFPEFL